MTCARALEAAAKNKKAMHSKTEQRAAYQGNKLRSRADSATGAGEVGSCILCLYKNLAIK